MINIVTTNKVLRKHTFCLHSCSIMCMLLQDDGLLTLGENIADNGGLISSYTVLHVFYCIVSLLIEVEYCNASMDMTLA